MPFVQCNVMKDKLRYTIMYLSVTLKHYARLYGNCYIFERFDNIESDYITPGDFTLPRVVCVRWRKISVVGCTVQPQHFASRVRLTPLSIQEMATHI